MAFRVSREGLWFSVWCNDVNGTGDLVLGSEIYGFGVWLWFGVYVHDKRDLGVREAVPTRICVDTAGSVASRYEHVHIAKHHIPPAQISNCKPGSPKPQNPYPKS